MRQEIVLGLRQERRIDIVSHPLENILSTATDEPAVKDNRERELSAQINNSYKKKMYMEWKECYEQVVQHSETHFHVISTKRENLAS